MAFQGGIDPDVYRIISICKHYAAYNIENGRTGNNVQPSVQDLSDYYLPILGNCVCDAKVGSIMRAYNAVDGIPALRRQLSTSDRSTRPLGL